VRLSDLGEVKTIEIIKNLISRKSLRAQGLKEIKIGIGDDCAVFNDGTIITTDAYIEDIHFSLDYFSLFDIGQRVACGTLSDIGAMAGKPIALFVSALFPSNMTDTQIKELYSGMLSISNRFNCEISGGDIVAYPKLGLILTAIGKSKVPKLRSTARPGDCLYITGYCGLAETGRLVLKNKLSRNMFRESVKRHICPVPRINEALKLSKYINAMIDTSDGLSTDAFHISQESKVRIKIFAGKLPIHQETQQLINRLENRSIRAQTKVCDYQTKSFAVNNGEDYELLFTSKYENLPQEILGTKVTKIGRIEKGRGIFLIQNEKEIPLLPKGYDHFHR